MSAAKLMGIFKKCLSTQDKKSHAVYFAGSEYEREMTLARERERTLHSLPAPIGEVMNYPVSVPRSLDGEEGYTAAQQRLARHQHHCDPEIERSEAVHPPPNRTAFEAAELPPPPPYSRRFTHPPGVGVVGGGRGAVRGSSAQSVVMVDSKQGLMSGSQSQQVMNGGRGGGGGTRCYNNNGGGIVVNNNNTNNVDLNAPPGGLPPYTHPSYQYHSPHVGAARGRPQQPHAPTTTTRGHSRHSSSSSTSSVGSSTRGQHYSASHTHPVPSLGGGGGGGDSPPPRYDDVIASTRHSPPPPNNRCAAPSPTTTDNAV